MSEILTTKNLTKEFSGHRAIDDVSVSFSSDKLYAIIGPNGAGKTTFFNLITSGEIYFNGEEITGFDPTKIARRKLIRSYQITQIFDSLTVLENILIAIQTEHNPYNFINSLHSQTEKIDQAKNILDEVNLLNKAKQPAEDLSHGEQRTLEIAIALGAEPEMLLLDEPSSGMSPEETSDVVSVVQNINTDIPIIFIEHKMSVVREAADEILVLHNGDVLAFETPAKVANNESVKQVYLGDHSL
jgi:branched-chain amino acid transport system ATP-binding protein